MKKFYYLLLICTILSFTAVNSFSASFELINNGNFDDNLTGWSTSGDVSIGTGGYLNFLQGNYARLGMNTHVGLSTLSQDFLINNTIKQVTLSFDMVFSGTDYNYDSSTYDDTVSLLFSAVVSSDWSLSSFDYYDTITSPDLNWYTIKTHYTATLDIVNFVDEDKDALVLFALSESGANKIWGNILVDSDNSVLKIDNISVLAKTEPVPEPASIFLIGSGILGLAGMRRKKVK